MVTGMQKITGISSSSLFAQSAMKLHALTLARTAAQISSGNRLVFGAIDPSGLGIATSFSSQLSGISQAIYNTQDTANLTRTADSALGTQQDVLIRMRDLAVRAAGDAALNPADQDRLDKEFQSLKSQITQTGQAAQFNTKQLLTDTPGQTYGVQTAQVGPGSADQLDVAIDPSTAAAVGIAGSDVATAATARQAITDIDAALQQVSSQRANLGVTENRLGFAREDLYAQQINTAASLSTIADTDIAATIQERNTGILLNQLAISALSQAKAQAFAVSRLLGA